MKNSAGTVHAGEERSSYEKHVNPQWARLLEVLQMNVSYQRCVGSELHTSDGGRILDFNSGYCVHNAGAGGSFWSEPLGMVRRIIRVV
jgi:hypothetical protein